MVVMTDISTIERPQWCPGCGNYGIHMALKQALVELSIEPHNAVIVSGIGCGSKLPHYVRTYGYEGIHGRGLPLASGIKLANPSLTVISVGGDGDGFSEGTNHFIHAARRNHDITYIVQDNNIYGLTTGQASPTTHLGVKTKTTPLGNEINMFKPIPSALVSGATFVAAGFAGNIPHLKEVIKQAIQHKGFSFIDVYQPCVTWNKLNTYDWYRERVYELSSENHNPSDWSKAWEKAWEPYNTNFEKIPIGVIYKTERKTADEIWGRGINFFEETKRLSSEGVNIDKLLNEFI